MNTDPETVDSLWAYCTANDRFAPVEWEALFNKLVSKHDGTASNAMSHPVLPWRLMNVVGTETKKQIQLNLREHIEWARDHGQLDELGRSLRSLNEREWIHLGAF